MSIHRTFAGIATAIVLVALVWGFAIVGSPISGRQQRFDDRRLEDLRAISDEIMNIVYQGKPRMPDAKPDLPVPVNLDEVVQKATYQRPNIMDPESGISYDYHVKSKTQYDLCASFNFERHQSYDIFWDHPAGQHCYSFDVTQQDGYARTTGGKPVMAPVR